jgi:hypothetical protein
MSTAVAPELARLGLLPRDTGGGGGFFILAGFGEEEVVLEAETVLATPGLGLVPVFEIGLRNDN